MAEWIHQKMASEFMPHGMCYLWRPEILWTHVVSDLLIAIAYFAIPTVLAIFLYRRKKSVPFPEIILLFTVFIFLCGSTHVISIYVTWIPEYKLEAAVKALTALASIATLEMINNLLEISEIQSEQEVKYSRSVIREVLFQIILDTEKEAIENGLQFEIIWQDETIVADTDVKRLKHIVRQILQNAVKFTCEGKVSIEVKAVTDCPENEKLLIAVADTGVGIEPEVQRRIFTPFSQLNVRLSHHQSGMGMGLAIAAQFCHDMGGEISLESEPGKGSLFSVELPLIRSLEEVKVKLPPKEIELF